MAKGKKSSLAIAKQKSKNTGVDSKQAEALMFELQKNKPKDYSVVNNIPFNKENEPTIKAFSKPFSVDTPLSIEPLSIVPNLDMKNNSPKNISDLFPVTNENADISESTNPIKRRMKSMLDFMRPVTGIDIGSGRLTPKIDMKNKSIGLQFKMPLGDY